jgi:C-terminal processing protease CtpA/Prc
MEKLERQFPVIGGGTRDWKINTTLRQLLWSQDSVKAELSLEINGQEENLQSKFIPGSEFAEKFKSKEIVKSSVLANNIGYLQIDSWSGDINIDGKNIAEIVAEHVTKLENTQGLIIDLRNNTGGNSEMASQLAGRFIDTSQIYTHVYVRENGAKPTEEDFILEPKKPKIIKPVVLLTSPKCLSSTEQFILMLKDTGHAVTIGETTGGGSGNPKEFLLTLGGKEYHLHVSTWRTKRNNGEMLESHGIEPDIETKVTPEEIQSQKDVDVEVALKYLAGLAFDH